MITVSVTAAHIAAGERDSCRFCPVALAIKEALPDVELIAVDSAYVSMGGPENWAEVGLPDAVTHFIEAFDLGDPVEPFTFTVNYPEAAS